VHAVNTFLQRSQTSRKGQDEPLFALNVDIVRTIDAAYDRTKQSDAYKVHRVLLSKIEEYKAGAGDTLRPTTDLGSFAKSVLASERDAPDSLRAMWTGRPREGPLSEEEEPELEGEVRSDGKTTDDEEEPPTVLPWARRMETILAYVLIPCNISSALTHKRC